MYELQYNEQILIFNPQRIKPQYEMNYKTIRV